MSTEITTDYLEIMNTSGSIKIRGSWNETDWEKGSFLNVHVCSFLAIAMAYIPKMGSFPKLSWDRAPFLQVISELVATFEHSHFYMHFIHTFNFVRIKWNQQSKYYYWLCFFQYDGVLCNRYLLYRFSVSKEMFWRGFGDLYLPLTLPLNEAFSSKRLVVKKWKLHAGEDLEKLESLLTADGNLKQYGHFVWKTSESSREKLSIDLSHHLSAPLGGRHSPSNLEQWSEQILVQPRSEQHCSRSPNNRDNQRSTWWLDRKV